MVTHLITRSKKSHVKKWLQMLAALKVRLPSGLRFLAVSCVISLYSTTWYLLSHKQNTPTGSVSNAFCTTYTSEGDLHHTRFQCNHDNQCECQAHLCPALCTLLFAKADKHRVGHFD